MKQGLFTLRNIEAVTDANDGLTIIPFGDIHHNAPMHAGKLFQRYCDELKTRIAAGENLMFIGLGDYLETFSASERKVMSGTLHESSQAIIDDMIMEACDKLAEQLDFTRGRWLGLLEGNHTYTNADGVSVSGYLSRKLGAGEPLGDQTNIGLYIAWPKKFGAAATGATQLDIWAHHGTGGGGQTVGNTFNNVEKFAKGRVGDLYLMGHDHHIGGVPGVPDVYRAGSRKSPHLESRQRYFVRTGSFLKGMVPDRVSYSTAAAYSPLPIGVCEVRVILRRVHPESADRDVRVVVKDIRPTPRVLG